MLFRSLSVRLDDGWLMTPTGVAMGELDPARLAKLDEAGRHVAGDAPTKETFLHSAMYEERPRAGAVVHLHSTHSVAVSCLDGIDAADVLPPLTAYYVMRVGTLPLVPYFPPGDLDLARRRPPSSSSSCAGRRRGRSTPPRWRRSRTAFRPPSERRCALISIKGARRGRV